MLDSVPQSPRYRFLACYFIECLRTPFASDYLIGHLCRFFFEVSSELARPRTFPQHTLPLLPLLRSRPGGVHKACVVRGPGSDKSISDCRLPISDYWYYRTPISSIDNRKLEMKNVISRSYAAPASSIDRVSTSAGSHKRLWPLQPAKAMCVPGLCLDLRRSLETARRTDC